MLYVLQGWLHRLSDQGTAKTENLLERAVTKSLELNLPVSIIIFVILLKSVRPSIHIPHTNSSQTDELISMNFIQLLHMTLGRA